jgi:hypothetical protein
VIIHNAFPDRRFKPWKETSVETREISSVCSAQSTEAVRTRRGLLLIVDRLASGPRRPDRMLPLLESLPPAQALERALEDISASYGRATAQFVALTMEYPYGNAKPQRQRRSKP